MSEWDASPAPQEYQPPASSAAGQAAEAIARVAAQAREAASSLFAQAGITIERALMTVSRSLRVEGDLESTGSTTISGNADITGTTHIGGATDIDGTLNVDADATFGGTMVVTGDAVFQGDLDVPNGSIGNDKLASPLVIVSAAPVTANNWPVGTTMGAKAASSIPVPPGFTRATVVAWANMHFQDTSPNGAWVQASIGGAAGAEMGGLANLNLGQSASHTRDLTGLSGGSITVSCDARASVATAGMPGRIAQINAVAYFQR